MSYALLTALVLVVVAFLVFTHREREATAQVLADVSLRAHEREQVLLQRIQAPQAEVVRYHYDQEEQHNPPAVRTDDDGDDDFWGARMSREDLARAAAQEEAMTGG